MKDFDPIKQLPDKTNIVNQRQVDYEKKFLGTTVRHRGHIMYEIDCSSGEVSEAEYAEERAVIVPHINIITKQQTGIDTHFVKDIITKENCLYVSALNIKSAKKKYFKWLIESKAQKIKPS